MVRFQSWMKYVSRVGCAKNFGKVLRCAKVTQSFSKKSAMCIC